MSQTTQRVALFAMILSLVLSGCLRSANSADLPDVEGQPPGELTQEPTAVAQVVTEMPEVTEAPTEAPPVEVTAEATVEVTEVVLATETLTAETTAFVLATETETPIAEATVFMLSTETLLPTQTTMPTATPTPTSTPTPTLTPAGEEVFPAQEPVSTEVNETPAVDVPAVAQNQEVTPVPPLQQTATALIQEATDTAEALTATAIGPTVAPATDVPTQQVPVDTLTPTTQAQQPPAVSGADCVHQVRAGENLFRISLRYGVSIQDIAVASGIANPNLILVGQRLTIPGCGTTGVVPPPTDPVTPAPGAGGTGGSVGGAGGGTVHVVQQYESLFEISMMYGVPISSIAAANGISNINLIIIGDQLTIPAS